MGSRKLTSSEDKAYASFCYDNVSRCSSLAESEWQNEHSVSGNDDRLTCRDHDLVCMNRLAASKNADTCALVFNRLFYSAKAKQRGQHRQEICLLLPQANN